MSCFPPWNRSFFIANKNELTLAYPHCSGLLFISFTTDWRFPSARSREMALAALRAGREVSYVDVEAAQGHDAFLLPVPRYLDVLRTYLAGLEGQS